MESESEEEYTYEDASEDGKYDDGENESGKTDSGRDSNGFSGKGEGMPMDLSRSRSGSDFTPVDGGYAMKCYGEIAPYMNAMINDVAGLLGVDPDQSIVLLQSTQWDKERLLEKFFSNGEKLFVECGLDQYSPQIRDSCQPPTGSLAETKWTAFSPTSSKSSEIDKDTKGTKDVKDVLVREHSRITRAATAQAKASRDAELKDNSNNKGKCNSNEFECRICCDYCHSSQAFSMGCGHQFCYDCYSEFINSQINEGPGCIYMHCPQHKCLQTIPQSIIARLANTECFSKYERYLCQKFINSNKQYKFCPAPSCDKIAVGSGVTNVKCTCGNSFCFRCGDEAHEPCSCDHLEAWNTKCQNESETANWILVNTKKCPNCQSRIEKNSGCNHITCKMCKHEFCWMCMGPWTEHNQVTGGFYRCNRYAGNPDDPSSEAEKAKTELNRYLHYYQRYHGHDHSLKFAATQRAQAERKMIETQESLQSSWIDVQFLHQATELVIECRRLLKYTYVLGYFLQDKTAEKQLFEHHQEMLEKNTERLQECTEQKIELIDPSQVINLTRVTEKFMTRLLESMRGGIVQDASLADGSDLRK